VNNHGVVVAVIQIEHERLVDLQFIHRHALELRQRRVAGAEIIHRQPQANAFQPRQHGVALLLVFHHRAFSDFQAQRLRFHFGVGKQVGDVAGQVFVEQVGGGDVDRQLYHQVLAVPFLQLCHSGFQHPAGQPVDVAGVFGNGNKFVRAQRAQCRVVPANQRLGTNALAITQRGFRLIQQVQSFAAQRFFQIACQ